MNITISIDRDVFLEKLSLSSHFTSSRLSSLTALQGILIKGEGEKLHLYATNLSSYYHTSLKIDTKETFQTIIEPKKIIEFLTLLSPGKLNVEVREKNILISQTKHGEHFPSLLPRNFHFLP